LGIYVLLTIEKGSSGGKVMAGCGTLAKNG
jgi:hypothetical protein